MKDYITKLELLGFIEYLRGNEITVESQIVLNPSFFARSGAFDAGETAKRIGSIIKHSPDSISAYRAIAHEKAKNNGNWRAAYETGFMFKEDVNEYIADMLNLDFSPEKNYVAAVKSARDGYNDVFSQEFLSWIQSYPVLHLYSRRILTDLFPTDYVRYCKGLFCPSDEKFIVERADLDGEYNGRKYEAKRIDDIKRFQSIALSYDANGNDIPVDDLIAVAKFLCNNLKQDRVYIRNYDSERMFVVYNAEK